MRPFVVRTRVLGVLAAVALLSVACSQPAPASPTAAPAKPAATAAPAKATEAAKPAAKPAEAKPAASPVAKPAEAKPAASPAAKPALSKAEGAAFDEKAVADFYRGKNIRILVGFAPGGGYDTSSRLVARFLPKYLPGNPNVVVENVTGAGSMIAANQVFRTAEKDGTIIGSFNSNLVLLQALGSAGIEYDARRFNWLASWGSSPSACIARADGPVKSFQETMAGKEWIIATEAPGTTTHDVPAVLKSVLGANLKLVQGYDGTSKLRLAVESKEVDGACWSWDSIKSTAQAWFDQTPPVGKVLIIMGEKTPDHPWLKDVPAAETLAKNPQDKQLLAAVSAPAEMTWPLAVAPEVPKDRVEALRQAMVKVSEDKEFQAETQKAKLDVTFSNAQLVEQKAGRVLSMTPDLVEKLKAALKG
jgi:tripartite-type tricarboxylate transporter receptor subunit TctC